MVLLGANGLAQDLQEVIRCACENDELEMDNRNFTLDYRVIDGDVSLPHNSFRTADFSPNGESSRPRKDCANRSLCTLSCSL